MFHSIKFKETQGFSAQLYSRTHRGFVFLLFIGLNLSLMTIGAHASPNSNTLSIKQIYPPLSMGLFTPQEGMVNSSFYFNLKPYVSEIKNHISYQVTNNLTHTLRNIELKGRLPAGITERGNYSISDCGKKFTLLPGQSCILNFLVDDRVFKPTRGNDPLLCSLQQCFAPLEEAQFNRAVELSPGDTYLEFDNESQDGLFYNPEHFAIEGAPLRAGIYSFKINAFNKYQRSDYAYLTIGIRFDPKDKPQFKINPVIPIASPNQQYQLNLMDLLESNTTYRRTNQIKFSIQECHNGASWLALDSDNPLLLTGFVPVSEAGNENNLCLSASSNTGGETYASFKLFVAPDPLQKPVIQQGIELEAEVFSDLNWFLKGYVSVPGDDSDLQISIDDVKPEALWLSVDDMSLEGVPPKEAYGVVYHLILRAFTKKGGSSEPTIVKLKIIQNPDFKPQFERGKPKLPLLVKGQPYVYDFVVNNDITPQYEEIPYTVSFATGYSHPAWLSIDNNLLKTESVPDDAAGEIPIYVIVKNEPGGENKPIRLNVKVM